MFLGINKMQASIIHEQRQGAAKAREVIERKKYKDAKEIKEKNTHESRLARESSQRQIEKLESEEVRMLEQLKQTQNREIAQIKVLKGALDEQKSASQMRLDQLQNHRY